MLHDRRPAVHVSLVRINVGCGSTPTAGWVNVDNSPSVTLAHLPLLSRLAARVLGDERGRYIQFCRTHDIRRMDATRRWPFDDGSADAVYSCHMLEHLTRQEADAFLREAFRVLRSRGGLRLVVPDLDLVVRNYNLRQDADELVADTLMATPGRAGHRWMYNGASLIRLVTHAGFLDARVMPSGTTRIPAADGLDLMERAPVSVCVEAVRP